MSTLNDSIRVTQRDTGNVLATYKGHTNSKYKSECTFSKNDKAVVEPPRMGVFMSGTLLGQKCSTLQNATRTSFQVSIDILL